MRGLLILLGLMAVAAMGLALTPWGARLRGEAREAAAHWVSVYRSGGTLERGNAMIAMADGVRLATDVYLPRDRAGKVPAILVRLPYGKRRYGEVRRWLRLFLPRGYAVVVQDMRGRWLSEGVFSPYPHAVSDGVATLDWIVAQGWSDGQVGTIGCSALGESQVMLGTARHPAHRAMIPIGAGGAIGTARGDGGFFGFFEGGVPALASAVGWFAQFGGKTGAAMRGFEGNPGDHLGTLPFRDAVARLRGDPTDFEDLLDRLGTPGAFDPLGYIRDDHRFATPALIVDAWYDQAVQSALNLAEVMAESAPGVQVVIGPGTHCDPEGGFWSGRLGDLAVDQGQRRDMEALYAAFMDHHLKGAPAPELAGFTVYDLRGDRWIESGSWPPEAAEAQEWPLSGEGLLPPGQGSAAWARTFVSDPADPAPSLGGAACCTGDPGARSGPVWLDALEGRKDVLTFTSPPLEAPLRIAGPVSARLAVSADVPDTDLVLRLADVGPDGRAMLIQEGALRLRYREGIEAPKPLPPGETVEARVRLRDIAWTVPEGHRLRLYVGGSSFPRLSRNMNGGGDPHRESVPRPARITLHGGERNTPVLELHALPE